MLLPESKVSAINEKQRKNSTFKTVQNIYSLSFLNGDCNNVLRKKSITVNGIKIEFEIYSGIAHTIVSKNVADQLFSGKHLLVKSNKSFKLILRIL